MYRLLLVDNEEMIVNNLYEIFHGIPELDLDVYKAYSGEEAIEWLNRTRIDIVVTDIHMPGMTGLQLMEEIFRSWPQCKVILLTGHNEFEYVYKAIQHRDVRYILKAEELEKVIQVVEETVSKIRKEVKTEDIIRNAKEQIHMALDLFQKDYLMCILNENRTVQVTREQFEQMAIPVHAEWPVNLVLGKINKFPDDGDYMQQMQQIYAVRQIIRRYLATQVNSVIVLDDNHRFVIFVQPHESLSGALPADPVIVGHYYDKALLFLKGILEVIQSACQDNIGISISFTVGSEAGKWEALPRQYHALSHLLHYRIGAESSILLVDSEIDNKLRQDMGLLYSSGEDEMLEIEKLETLLKRKNLSVLEQYLESGQRDKYFADLEQLLAPLRSIRSKENSIALEAYYTVSLYLFSYMNRWRLSDKIPAEWNRQALVQLDRFHSWEDAAAHLVHLSGELFDRQTQEQKKRADHTIGFLEKFIEEHIQEDLSLVRLAEQVYLNPSYLSRIYKQETGRNLTDFIDSIRLSRAKELLHTDNMRINDIARRIGYETATSFTRFFKKATGCSPQEYRERQLVKKQPDGLL